MPSLPPHRPDRLRHYLPLAALAGSVAMLFLIAFLGWRSATTLSTLLDEAREVEQATQGLRDVLVALLNAETGQRGYLITGEDRYLDPYRSGVRDVSAALARLERSATHPVEAAGLAKIRADTARKLAELDRTLAMARDGDRDGARRVILSDEGRDTMQRIRAELDRWRQDRIETLDRHGRSAIGAARDLSRIGTAGFVVAVALLSLAGWLGLAERRRRLAAERESARSRDALQKAHADLSRQTHGYIHAMQEVAYRYDWLTDRLAWERDTTDLFGEDLSTHPISLNEWFSRVHPDDLAALLAGREQRLRSTGVFREAVRARHRDGRWRWIELRGVIHRDDTGRPVETIGVFRDVDDLITAERERSAAARQFDALLASIRDGFLAVDDSWTYVYVNDTAARILFKSRTEMIGRTMWDVFPTARGLPFEAACLRVKETGEPLSLEQYFDLTGRWYLNHIYPFGSGLSIFLEDITDRKMTEQQRDDARHRLAHFAEELDRTMETERTEIARRIHDDLGQALTALKYDVAWIERRLSASDASDGELLRAHLDAMKLLIDETVASARHLARDLRPAALTDLGLATVLRAHARDWSARAGIACDCDVDDTRLPPPAESALYRIALEACTNILRHAGASRAWIRLKAGAQEAELEVGDDGTGFDPVEISRRGSLGLLGITERAALLGGRAAIESSPGRGTRIRVRLPLAPAPDTSHREPP